MEPLGGNQGWVRSSGWGPGAGIRALVKEGRDGRWLGLFERLVRTEPGRGSRRTRPRWGPDLGLLASQTTRRKCLLFEKTLGWGNLSSKPKLRQIVC